MQFNCSHCNQSLDADEAMAGDEIQCPACGRYITVPGTKPERPAPTLTVNAASASPSPTNGSQDIQPVQVVDVKIPFMSLLILMLKVWLASIPLAIMLGIAYLIVAVLMLGGCGSLMMMGAQ